jgi:hypothetical protein
MDGSEAYFEGGIRWRVKESQESGVIPRFLAEYWDSSNSSAVLWLREEALKHACLDF